MNVQVQGHLPHQWVPKVGNQKLKLAKKAEDTHPWAIRLGDSMGDSFQDYY